MTSLRYKAVSNRYQISLLPPSIEDCVQATNPVRAIDAYVNTLDLTQQGFQNTFGGIVAGQPAYPPADLLKLYLYGYINKVRSSRRLESETYRNFEVIWLVEALRPSYKTIADFRKNNSKALTATNCDFVLLCKELHPFGTLKRRAGWDHFLMRGLEKSKGAFSLMVLGYNFTRVLNILGIDRLRDYCV